MLKSTTRRPSRSKRAKSRPKARPNAARMKTRKSASVRRPSVARRRTRPNKSSATRFASVPEFRTAKSARASGASHGRSGAKDAIAENSRGYRSVRDALSGWGEHASEAASTLRVPPRFRRSWEDAYEDAARATAEAWVARQERGARPNGSRAAKVTGPKLNVERVLLDAQGYTKGKHPQYFGTGTKLWRYYDDAGDVRDGHVRAPDVKTARERARDAARLSQPHLFVDTSKTLVLKPDYENNAEAFWSAVARITRARQVPKTLSADATRAVYNLSARGGHAVVNKKTGDEVLRYLRTVPGFSDGPSYAKNAVILREWDARDYAY